MNASPPNLAGMPQLLWGNLVAPCISPGGNLSLSIRAVQTVDLLPSTLSGMHAQQHRLCSSSASLGWTAIQAILQRPNQPAGQLFKASAADAQPLWCVWMRAGH